MHFYNVILKLEKWKIQAFLLVVYDFRTTLNELELSG